MKRFAVTSCLLIGSLWLLSCESAKPPDTTTLTLKRDGSHFYGTVVRRDASSITVTGTSGDTHTYLLTELSDMQLSTGGEKTAPVTPTTNESPSPAPLPAGGGLFEQPRGTQFEVRNNGFLDSCCLRMNDIELGVLDADITNPQGAVMIPRGR